GVAASVLPRMLSSGGNPGSAPRQATPGHPMSMKDHVLHTGAHVMQDKAPVDAMSVYLNGFHFYADDMGRQVEAHHFCTHLNHDFHQCVIYDANTRDARLIGIEYIVSERLFRSFPEEEKRLWHSHHYEVKSGELLAPGLPELAERAALRDIVTTYGKTWHTWQIDRDDLPMGLPQLMMGFTRDGQVNADLLRQRDRRVGISSDGRRRDRADIPMPTLVPGANAWEDGPAVQTRLVEVELANRRS
ncbi:MAG: OBAP family protein, partial [Acetobacteraceae bacterium]